MSILIKGMEMPEGCFDCILSFMWFNGTETVLQCNVLKKLVSDDGSKDLDCPLTEIPQHGRLIDADELMTKMIEYGWHHPDSTVHEFVEDELHTVIPADKDGET